MGKAINHFWQTITKVGFKQNGGIRVPCLFEIDLIDCAQKSSFV